MLYHTMFGPQKFVFVPFFLLSLSLCGCAVCAGSSFDLRALLPTYNQGVNNYNSILRSLVNLDTSAETTSDAVFFQEILQYATSSLNGFSQCAALATTKGDTFAAEEVRLVSQLSTKQQTLQAKEQERVEQQQKLNSARNQLSTQSTRLQSAINTLSGTESALRDAEKKVDDAKKCIRVRRKRGFGGFFKKVRNAVSRPFKPIERAIRKPVKKIINFHKEVITFPLKQANRICGEVLNRLTGALKDARRARDQARAAVNNQQNGVNTAKQQLASAQIKLNQLVQAKAVLQQEIEGAKIEIAKFRAQHKKVVDLKDKLRQVSTHLAAVKAPYGPSISAIQKSQKLSVLDKVEGLLSLESLIGQLQDVAGGLSGSAGSVPRFMQITNVEKQRLKSQIEAFKEKLRQLEEDVDADAVNAVEDFE